MRDITGASTSATHQATDQRVESPSSALTSRIAQNHVPAMSWDDPESRPAAWVAFGAPAEGGEWR